MIRAPDGEPAPGPEASATCPRCKERFHCGVVGGSERCWCMAMPPLRGPRSGKGCYCQACLALLTTPGAR